MKNVLQIPSDVGAYCRKAAQVLESSHQFLADEIEDQKDDFSVCVLIEDITLTRDNLKQAAAFLNWLADHGEHGQPVEAVHEHR